MLYCKEGNNALEFLETELFDDIGSVVMISNVN